MLWLNSVIKIFREISDIDDETEMMMMSQSGEIVNIQCYTTLLFKQRTIHYYSNSEQYTAASVRVLASIQFFICHLADDKCVLQNMLTIERGE
jgi:hypothetical protein